MGKGGSMMHLMEQQDHITRTSLAYYCRLTVAVLNVARPQCDRSLGCLLYTSTVFRFNIRRFISSKTVSLNETTKVYEQDCGIPIN